MFCIPHGGLPIVLTFKIVFAPLDMIYWWQCEKVISDIYVTLNLLVFPTPSFSVNFIVLVLCKSVWSRNLVRYHCTADLLFPWFVPIQWNLHSVLIGSSESKSQILAKPRRNKYVFFHSYTRLLTRPLIHQYRLK